MTVAGLIGASVGRRTMLKGGATISLAAPFAAIMEAQANASVNGAGEQLLPVASPYGPIAPVKDLATGLYLLQLPKGFSYRSMSWTRDLMSDGQRCAASHDGMAVVQMTGGRTPETILIRNHEVGAGPRLEVPGGVYDPVNIGQDAAGGGCTILKIRNGQLVDSRAAIGGTIVNCAGGRSLWNSWLTCEETTTDLTAQGGKKHGYIFDVPTNPGMTSPVPLVAMGRFSHEAIASDPVTGYIYETEDARNISAFYRFKPANTSRTYRSLEDGGVLQAAKIVGVDKANLLALAGVRVSDVAKVGDSFAIEWVDIADPDASPTGITETGPDTSSYTASGPYVQARNAGALRMSRGEGIWWDHSSECFYVVDTSFGYEPGGARRAGRGLGSVWAYHPDRTDPDKGRLTLVYAAAARVAGNNPDNVTVSPRGGIITCDDGSNVVDEFGAGQRMMGFRDDGLAYILVKNNVQITPADLAKMGRTGQIGAADYRGSEFAGACFDWSGRTLFANIQTPGITFAITGPWGAGNL
jgi:uncharacterized protein